MIAVFQFVVAILSFFFCEQTLYAIFPINLFPPWDINLRPPTWKNEDWQITSYVEAGYDFRAVDGNHTSGNVMHIWNKTEDAISMLKGFGPDSPMTQLLNDIEAAVGGTLRENANRGHFNVNGKFRCVSFGAFARYHFPYDFTLGLYVPFYSMGLKNIRFESLTSTSDEDLQDVVVRDMLTDAFFNHVAAFDPTLNLLGGWDRTGLGDIDIVAEWARDFRQSKPILKNVAIDVRAGVTLPTGKRTLEDVLLAVPFGNDGGVGIIAGGGIKITWLDFFRAGLDFEILQIFGNTRVRRIKTDVSQTDFLLLAKDVANKEFGFTQRYNLFFEIDPIAGFYGSVIYQFFKHSADSLALASNRFSNLAANSAESLQEWTMHHVIFKIGYDFQNIIDEDSFFKPQVMAFCKLPFNGKRAILAHTVGGTFTLNF